MSAGFQCAEFFNVMVCNIKKMIPCFVLQEIIQGHEHEILKNFVRKRMMISVKEKETPITVHTVCCTVYTVCHKKAYGSLAMVGPHEPSVSLFTSLSVYFRIHT